MAHIRIEWLADSHDCETCGISLAYGARVYVDGEQVLDMPPHAHCYDGVDYEPDEVYKAILATLGHTFEEMDTDLTAA